MGWILNLLVQGLIGLILDVVADIMSWFSFGLGKLFSTSDFFDKMFLGVNGPELIKLFTMVGITLCIGLVLVGIVRSIMAGFGWTNESPFKMLGRLVIGVVLCFTLYNFLSTFLYGGTDSIFYKIFENSSGVIDKLTNATISDYNFMDAGLSLSVASLSGVAYNLLLIFLSIAILTNFIKLLLELFERYILLNVALLFAPIAPAGLVLESTTRVFQGYIKFVFGQMMILWFDNIFFALSIGALEYAAQTMESIQAIKSVLVMFALLAFLKIFQRLDNYMRDVGMIVGITGSSLLTEVYAAAKTFGALKKNYGKSSGGTGGTGGAGGGIVSNAGAIAGIAAATAAGGGSSTKYSSVSKSSTRSPSWRAFTMGTGEIAVSRAYHGAKAFIGSLGEARHAGMGFGESMKWGAMHWKDSMNGSGKEILNSVISPGARKDIKVATQKTTEFTQNAYNKFNAWRGSMPISTSHEGNFDVNLKKINIKDNLNKYIK